MTCRLAVCCLLLAALTGCASTTKPQPILSTVPLGKLEWAGDLPILYLSGSPYEMGYQHGSLLREQVRASVKNAMAFIDRQAWIPIIGRWLVHRTLDRAWRQMAPFVPDRYLEELQGLSDGAGVPFSTLTRIHALPDLMATTCSSFAAFGSATRDGRLIQIRNLDWAIQSDVQRFAAIFLLRPAGGQAFVNIGWLGFIGVISGINENQISVGEIGAETVDAHWKGIPMPFLQRQVLEEAQNLEDAVHIVQSTPRTGGYNYLFGDAKGKKAVALETTKSRVAVFWPDEVNRSQPFVVSVPNAVFRSDWAVDPQVREFQLACKGDPRRPGLESPRGSTAYDVRYAGQGQLLLRFHGQIDSEVAMAIARAIAPSSNIQSVVYAYPELWVANASKRRPAAMGKFMHLDLADLFKE